MEPKYIFKSGGSADELGISPGIGRLEHNNKP